MDRVVYGYELAPDQIQAKSVFHCPVHRRRSAVSDLFRQSKGDRRAWHGADHQNAFRLSLNGKLHGGHGNCGLPGRAEAPRHPNWHQGSRTILPMSDAKPADVAAGSGKATIAFPDGVRLIASDWAYDVHKKRASFSSGTLTLADGKVIVITDGRIAFDHSRDIFVDGAVQPAGLLETKLKPGDYPIGADTLVIGKGNASQVKPGVSTSLPVETEKPKASLEQVEWVKPDNE